MDVIRRIADDFGDELENYGLTLERIDSELSSKLLYISKIGEKLRFLSYLNDIAEKKYKEHAPKCRDPRTCTVNRCLENSLYAIRQQYDEYIGVGSSINYSEKPAMKFFNEGQYFDAYSSIKEIIKDAKHSIVIVDGYVDENTLALLPSKSPQIELRILTSEKSKSSQFDRAIELYKKQYENIFVFYTKDYHDRFLIIDSKEFYHFGASLKDAGNKVFMYSKIEDKEIQTLLNDRLKGDLK